MLWLLTQMELEWPGAHSRVTARYLPLPSQLKGLCCRTHLLLPPEIIPFLVAFTFIPPPIRKINGRANLLSLRSRNWRSFPGGHRVVKQLPSTRSLTHTRSNFPALVSLTPRLLAEADRARVLCSRRALRSITPRIRGKAIRDGNCWASMSTRDTANPSPNSTRAAVGTRPSPRRS